MSDTATNLLLLGVAVVAVVGLSVAARRVLRTDDVDTGPWSSSLSYVSTAYGVVIGFSILFLFGQFASARSAVADEATSISTAYEQAALFPESAAGIQRALVCYGRAVVAYDWPAMREESSAPEVDAAYRDLVRSLGVDDVPSTGALHSATATNLVSQVGSISTARESRLAAAETNVPTMLWILLVGGGALVLVLMFVVTTPASPRVQAALVAAATAFTLVMLLLVVALDDPYAAESGRITPRLIEESLASMSVDADPETIAPCDQD